MIVTCPDIDECANANGGCQQQCINEEGSFRCECFDGFKSNENNFCVGKTIVYISMVYECGALFV